VLHRALKEGKSANVAALSRSQKQSALHILTLAFRDRGGSGCGRSSRMATYKPRLPIICQSCSRAAPAAAARAGELGQELVDAFDQEARRWVANGTFYGVNLFMSLTAGKIGE